MHKLKRRKEFLLKMFPQVWYEDDLKTSFEPEDKKEEANTDSIPKWMASTTAEDRYSGCEYS